VNPGQWAYYHIFNRPPGERTVLPIGPSIVGGLIVFVLIVGISVGIGFLSYNAGMGALVTLAMLALAFGYRSGMLAILGATFVSLLPAAMAIQGVDDYKHAKSLRTAVLSPAEMPRATEANVFVVKDFRVATKLAHVYRTQRTAGEPASTVFYGVTPLVPAAWKKGEAVPAWLACSGGEESWCATVFAHPLRAATPVDRREYERYRFAIEAAAQRHGLTTAATPLVVNHAEPPGDRAGGALTGIIVMPILGFVVWLLGFLVWRAIKPAKAPAPVQG
jgi:hypothetical protein